jgi:hypothetical protein
MALDRVDQLKGLDVPYLMMNNIACISLNRRFILISLNVENCLEVRTLMVQSADPLNSWLLKRMNDDSYHAIKQGNDILVNN